MLIQQRCSFPFGVWVRNGPQSSSAGCCSPSPINTSYFTFSHLSHALSGGNSHLILCNCTLSHGCRFHTPSTWYDVRPYLDPSLDHLFSCRLCSLISSDVLEFSFINQNCVSARGESARQLI